MVRVAINGFGRIGRIVFRAGVGDKRINFVAINDLGSPESLAHLLKYDSVHGRFNGRVKAQKKALVVNGKKIALSSERNPEMLPWKEHKVDIVLECTGIFRKIKDVKKHIKAGAKKVMLSAPPKGENIPLFVLGVNDSKLTKSKKIISNASCTTNCLAPIVKIINDKFGISNGFITTVHGYTSDQRLVDANHSDMRRARAAAANIIPTTTGAAKAIGKVIPKLAGKMDGIAMRVPVVNGSITDMVFVLKKAATAEQINAAVKKAAMGKMKGIVEYTEDPIVSTDIIGNPHSSIFDSGMTSAMGKTVKLLSWYDNEWGYSCRMIDLIKKMF